MRSLSPTSVLIFVEDELPIKCRRVVGQKTKRCDVNSDELGNQTNGRSINLRHHLVCNETVRWISTRRQRLEKLHIGPLFESAHDVFAMIDTLPGSVTQLDLDLRNVLHILPEVFSRLFQPKKRHLTSLSIRLFGDSGAIELSKWLHNNPNLRRLDLRGNRIGNVGLEALVKSLSQCDHRLEVLDLGCNCILDVKPLSELLQRNTHLTKLDLNYNWIGDEDIGMLCIGLRENKCLQMLSINGCQRVTNRGISLLVECLKDHNTTLQHVHVRTGNGTSEGLQTQLQQWLVLNRAGRRFIRCQGSTQSPLWSLIFHKNNTDPTVIFTMLKNGGTVVFGDAATSSS